MTWSTHKVFLGDDPFGNWVTAATWSKRRYRPRHRREIDRGIMHSTAEKTRDDYISICRRRRRDVSRGSNKCERMEETGIGERQISCSFDWINLNLIKSSIIIMIINVVKCKAAETWRKLFSTSINIKWEMIIVVINETCFRYYNFLYSAVYNYYKFSWY